MEEARRRYVLQLVSEEFGEGRKGGHRLGLVQVEDVLVRGLVVNEPELVVRHGGAVVLVAEDLEAQAQREVVVFEGEGEAVQGVENFGEGAVCPVGALVHRYLYCRGMGVGEGRTA